jgi:hypothetical protein
MSLSNNINYTTPDLSLNFTYSNQSAINFNLYNQCNATDYLNNLTYYQTNYSEYLKELTQLSKKWRENTHNQRAMPKTSSKLVRNKITDMSNFKTVKPGYFAFLAHVNKFTHLTIYNVQKFLHMNASWSWNITHVGVVTNVKDDKIEITHIPGYGEKLTTDEIVLSDLKSDEELLFASPIHKSAPVNLRHTIQEVGRTWTKKNSDDSETNTNQYNLEGLIKLPINSRKLEPEDKRSLIHAWIDFQNKRPPHKIENGVLIQKPYFCSELASEIYQFSRLLLSTLSQKEEDVLKQFSTKSINELTEAVKFFERRWNAMKIWDKFADDPLFQLSSRAASPSLLFEMAMHQNGAIRVRNPDKKEHFDESAFSPANSLPLEKQLELVEYQAAKLLKRYLDGEKITEDDPEIQRLLILLEGDFGYSKGTLNCFIKECLKHENPSTCVEQCLNTTLTLKEKLAIFLFSRQVDRAMDQLVDHFLEIVQNRSQDKLQLFHVTKSELSVENVLEKLYPLSLWNPIASLENFLAKYIFRTSDAKTLIKYLPLAIAYSPPTKEISRYMEEKNTNLREPASIVHEFLSSMKELNDNPNSFLKKMLPKALGVILQNSGLADPFFDRMQKESGYSKETLKCLAHEFVATGALDSAKASYILSTCVRSNRD